MYSSRTASFVQTLTSDIKDLVEASFYLSYYVGIQPSEIDRLSTYEFNRYIDLMNEQVKSDKEYALTMAQSYGMAGFLGAGRS